jgi:hypothetical protein
MSSAKRLIIASLATVSLASSAWAGRGGDDLIAHSDDKNDPWIALAYKIHRTPKYSPPVKAAIAVGRAGESFLHWPRFFPETLYGDRPFVSKKGILVPRETPIEDQIYSPGE